MTLRDADEKCEGEAEGIDDILEDCLANFTVVHGISHLPREGF